LLLVTATLQNNQLLYTIQDNGIGRKKAAEKNSISPSHQSYGMQLTKERTNWQQYQHYR
jgi:nitrate/nitrite-specific signal transduction histidine kinase